MQAKKIFLFILLFSFFYIKFSKPASSSSLSKTYFLNKKVIVAENIFYLIKLVLNIFVIALIFCVIYYLIKKKNKEEKVINISLNSFDKEIDFEKNQNRNLINNKKGKVQQMVKVDNIGDMPVDELLYRLTLFSDFETFKKLIFIKNVWDTKMFEKIDFSKNVDDVIKERFFFSLSPSCDNQNIIKQLFKAKDFFLKNTKNGNQLSLNKFIKIFYQCFCENFFVENQNEKDKYIQAFKDAYLTAAVESFFTSIICSLYLLCQENKIDFNIDLKKANKNRKILFSKLNVCYDTFKEFKTLKKEELEEAIKKKINQSQKKRFFGFCADKNYKKYLKEVNINFLQVKENFDNFKKLYSFLQIAEQQGNNALDVIDLKNSIKIHFLYKTSLKKNDGEENIGIPFVADIFKWFSKN